MASLFSMSRSQLENLKRDQERAIREHKNKAHYPSQETQHKNILKRLETRLQEIEAALQRF